MEQKTRNNPLYGRLNLFFGLFLFVVFLGTGFYLSNWFHPENLENIPARLQIRSNHIYILLIALLNIAASKFQLHAKPGFIFGLGAFGKISLIVSGVLAFLAFCYEHTGDITQRSLSFFTILMSLVGMGSLLLVELWLYVKEKAT
ncbi:MAG: hypothetical protein AAF206_30980 [Bacteroidota bacterium]